MKNKFAEIIRKKYLYRRLLMTKRFKISLEAAKKLIGPDTAYHLYSKIKKKD